MSNLADLLRGANITINVHHGTGDINSQSGHRITQNNAAAPERAEAKRVEWTYRCELCGYTSHVRNEFIRHGGYGHRTYNCLRCDQQLIDNAQEWQRVRQEAIDSDATPAQIAAPQDAPELIVIDEPRLSRYEAAKRKADEAYVSWMAGQGRE